MSPIPPVFTTTVTHAEIVRHSTAFYPWPYVLYTIEVTTPSGSKYEVSRRYSEFAELHTVLGDSETLLPPNINPVTSFLPSAWVDNQLIAERKADLSSYLAKLLKSPKHKSTDVLETFLSSSTWCLQPLIEDAFSSTPSPKTAQGTQKTLTARSTTPIAAAYYPDYALDSNPPADLDFSEFDILFFAFAMINDDSTLTFDSGATTTLETLVSSAHSSVYDTKIVLSIGESGQQTIQKAVGSATTRSTFVDACVDAINTYDLDGVDIDWVYPGETGAGNLYSSDDAANLLTFFEELRTTLGADKVISAAVGDEPWIGSDGSPLTDLSAYAEQMTYANIMNYDVHASSTTAPGPNAPLGNLCGNSTRPEYSAEAAFAMYTQANFPASQLLWGVPFYGYCSETTVTTLTDMAVPATASDAGNLSAYWGEAISFGEIISAGVLEDSDGTYVAANGYTEDTPTWDSCSDTPFLYDVVRTTVVTFDDTTSLGDKAAYALNAGMAGCFAWSLNQDNNYVLQNAVRTSLGLS